MAPGFVGQETSYDRGVPQLEDDACGRDAAGLLETLSETVRKGRASMQGLVVAIAHL